MATNSNSKEKEKWRFGEMPCEGSRCRSHDKNIPVVIWENKNGTLSYHCPSCDRRRYVRPGTEEHEDWMHDIKLFNEITPEESGRSAAPVPDVAPVVKGNQATEAPKKKPLLF